MKTWEYYNKFIGNIGQCQRCSSKTNFINLSKGYSNCCGQRCSKLLDCQNPDYIKKISDGTKKAMNRDDVKKKMADYRSKPLSKNTISKMSQSAKEKFIKNPELKSKIYTDERNRKISQSKIRYWENNEIEKKRVGKIWTIWKERDEVGWRKHLMSASKIGFNKIYARNGGDTSLEVKIYKMLEVEKINYIKKYELGGKVYDAFLPDYNILLEVDGDFWHKNSIEECVYDFQKESYYNDILKNSIADDNHIKIVRIKEKQIPLTIKEIL